ncbi:proprotein convertase subtilisin/kexin type 5-like [Centroberyx affinis]|uniref:proprotein convertase subtilisin/kexin type 5-like n=1 Tax=Centroberyx affinis TaxID=166261 RepID=UPI003A5BD8B1
MSSQGEYMSRHGKCHLCDATCEQCMGPEREDCTSCPATRFFDDGRCDIRCQRGRYAMGRQCHLCHHTCQECNDDGPDNCTSCDKDRFGVDRYQFQGQCRDVCPEGFFHSWRRRCEPCPADCTVCTAADHCLHCAPGHKLRDKRCIPLECGAGEVADPEYEDCLPCDEGCKTCKHNRTYSVNDSMVCARCADSHCVNCDQYQCYWCEEGFYVSGFFVDEESQDCEPCHRSCRTCGGPKYNDCDSCEDGFTLKDGECLEDTQFVLCPDKHFRNGKGDCEQCHSSCKTCFDGGREDCSSCYSGSFLTARQSCVSRCPPGTFSNRTSGQCEDCLPGCVVCQDGQRCQRCRSGRTQLYLQDGVCVVECQRGFPQGGVCQPCAPQCASCQGNASHCLSCDSQYLLLDRSCRSHCPDGYYATETECLRCPPDCKECNHDGLCQECAEYYFLHDDKCVDDCPTGYFAGEEQQECVRCHADCASCDGPDWDDCDVCRNPKAVRYNGECLPQCPTNTYHDKNTHECRDCDRSCLTCSGPEPSSCLSCDTNMRKDASGHCVWYSQCSLRSYMGEDGECQLCHPLCHRCSGPGKDHCLSCNSPRFLLNDTCVEECPVGYYGDRDERECNHCHFSCESCVGRHSVQCVTCKPGHFRQGNSCTETCSESHFGNTTTWVCDRCDPSCSRCWARSSRDCLSCREGYLYLRQWGQCLKSCPPGYYKDSWSKTCRKCHPTCKTCRGFYAESQGSDSPDAEPNCEACDESCLDCRGAGVWNCTVCPALQILSDDGRCLSCCGNEARPDGTPIPRECCDCEASREECILSVNFVLRGPEESEVPGGPAKLFVTACVLLIVAIGGVVFLFLQARSRALSIPGAPKIKAGGYEKLDNNGGVGSQPATSSFGEYSDRIVECEDDEEEDDEEDDIVYMGQDGTVYRKFKYGLLDEDEEIELEYDDESYSYR